MEYSIVAITAPEQIESLGELLNEGWSLHSSQSTDSLIIYILTRARPASKEEVTPVNRSKIPTVTGMSTGPRIEP